MSPGQGHEHRFCVCVLARYSTRVVLVAYRLARRFKQLRHVGPSLYLYLSSLLSLRSQTTSELARSEISLTGHDIS